MLEEASKVYDALMKNNIEVLFDDRASLSPGEKFADSDLVGIPVRLVVSARSMKEGGVEIKKRNEAKGSVISLDALIETLTKKN